MPRKNREQKKEENKEKIAEIINQWKQEMNPRPKSAINRNIIFVGKTRSGKSTVFNVLKNPVHIARNLKLDAGTVTAQTFGFTVRQKVNLLKLSTPGKKKELGDSFTVGDELANLHNMYDEQLKTVLELEKEGGKENLLKKKVKELQEVSKKILKELEKVRKFSSDVVQVLSDDIEKFERSDQFLNLSINFNLSIIDTPGLFERKKKNDEGLKRDNKTLKKMIIQAMESEVTKIHCIFFVFSFATGVNAEDMKAFAQFSELFQDAKDKISMIVTRAELYDVDRKIQIRDEVKNHKELRQYAEQVEGKIFFSGCVEQSDIDNDMVDLVEEKLENILDNRDEIYTFIFKNDKFFQIDKLSFLQEYEQELINEMQEFKKGFENYGKAEGELKTKKKLELEENFKNNIEANKSFAIGTESRTLYKEVLNLHKSL